MRKGGLVSYVKDKETKCLTEDQAKHIYKKVESNSVVNVDTIKQEIVDDKLTRDKYCTEEDEINQYQNVLLNIRYTENIPRQQKWNIAQF